MKFLILLTSGYSMVAAMLISNASYATWMTDSMIQRGVEPGFGYDQATLYTSLEAMYEYKGNESVKNFFKDQIDAVVFGDGSIADYNYSFHSLDNYRLGNNLLWWFLETEDEKYRIAANSIKEVLDGHPRTPTGGFWHREPVYPDQMWLDGIYMADSFYAKWVHLFQPDNHTAWDDIILQFDNIEARTRKENKLMVHGYDESKTAVWADPENGAAPLVWARAVGWYFMSLLEVIEVFPKEHPGRQRLIGYFVELADGLKAVQDELGGWWNVMDEQYEDIEGNYVESSASAMFTFGWLKGLNQGLLEEIEYGDVSAAAYRSLVGMFITHNSVGTINWEGTVEVGSLNSNATFEYYSSIPVRQNDLRGAGAFIVAAVEWEKRLL